MVGLTQQSDVASSETYAQWKRHSKTGNAKECNLMDLTQLDSVPSQGSEMLFFMGQDDLNLRDHETEEDLAYWDEELLSEDTTITEMVRGRADTTSKTCYHCNNVGHFKAQCPQCCIKDKGDPGVHLRSEEEEEQGQVAYQTTHGEEGAHHRHGHEELHVVEEGTSTVVLESPRSPSSGKTTTMTMSKPPRTRSRIFRGG